MFRFLYIQTFIKSRIYRSGCVNMKCELKVEVFKIASWIDFVCENSFQRFLLIRFYGIHADYLNKRLK